MCDIEVTDVDSNRQMEPETMYEITFTNDDGKTFNVADVSEYPMGSFTIIQTNKNIVIDERRIVEYFEEQACGEDIDEHEENT